jgi:hypothetical protein
MPSHDAGKTRFAPIRSLGKNLPPGRSPPDHDDEPQLQFLRSWNQSITAETHLTDVVGQTDTIQWTLSAQSDTLPATQEQCLFLNELQEMAAVCPQPVQRSRWPAKPSGVAS